MGSEVVITAQTTVRRTQQSFLNDIFVCKLDTRLCVWFTKSTILHTSIQDTSHFLPVQIETCSVLPTWRTWRDNHTGTSWLEQVLGQNWVVMIWLCELNEPRAETGKLDGSQTKASLHRRGGAARLFSANTQVTSQLEKAQSPISYQFIHETSSRQSGWVRIVQGKKTEE